MGANYRLDEIDKRILYELDLNGRLSAADLGRKLSITKETANSRIKRLEERKIISRYSAILNISKLGQTPYGVFTQLENVSEKEKKDFIKALIKEDCIYSVALFGGKYDLLFAIGASDIIEFDRHLSRITGPFTEHIGKMDVATRIEVNHFRRSYLIKRKTKTDAPYFGREIEQETLDDLDSELLRALAGNGRISLTQLAENVGVPRSTARLRLTNLEKRKVIQRYQPLIHPERFGYQLYKLLITVDRKNSALRDELFKYCNDHPNINFFVHSVGKWDFEVSCEVENQTDLQEIISDLRNSFPRKFTNIETIITFDNMVKYQFAPPG